MTDVQTEVNGLVSEYAKKAEGLKGDVIDGVAAQLDDLGIVDEPSQPTRSRIMGQANSFALKSYLIAQSSGLFKPKKTE